MNQTVIVGVTQFKMRIRSAFKRIINNDYVFTILTKVFAVAIGLVASSFSNRFLGAELKGQLGSISSLLSVIAVSANFGLYQPYPYYKRQKEPYVLERFLNIFSFQFIVYLIIGLACATQTQSLKITAVCLLAPIQVLANQLSFIIMVEDVKFKNIIFFIARIANTLITIIAFYTMKRTILVSLSLIVIGDVITIFMVLARLKCRPNPFKTDFSFLIRIIPFGIVSMITTLMLTLNYRIDTLMMDYMFHIPDREIGFYTLGVSLSEYGWLIPDAFREVLFSRTARSDAIDDVIMSLKINFYLTLCMIAGIVLVGKLMIRILAGIEFLPSYSVTVFLIIGILPMSWFKIVGTLLLAQGKKYIYLLMLSISVLVNIVCNIIAIPIWGKLGAAAASVASYTAAGIMFLGYFLHRNSIPLRQAFLFNTNEIYLLQQRLGRLRKRF